MGIRQSAQPLGVALAAVTLPALWRFGHGRPLLFLGGSAWWQRPGRLLVTGSGPLGAPGAGAVERPAAGLALPPAGAVADPRGQRAAGGAAVHRGDVRAGLPGRRARLDGARGRPRCWPSRRSAARVAARGRLLVRPGRQPHAADAVLAVTTGAGMLAWLAAAAAGSSIAVPDPAGLRRRGGQHERAGLHRGRRVRRSAWAGRALGIQNTGQNALAAATPPVLALAIGSIGFGASFAVVAAFPLVAAAFVPVSAEGAAVRAPLRARRIVGSAD